MGDPVTLRLVADAAGVGLATASRALAGDRSCAAATRARVLAVAGRLGYVPDPGVAALARRRRGGPGNRYPLAWLSERPRPSSGADRILFEAVRAEAEARGYLLAWASLPALGGAKAAGPALHQRGVVGCFVSSLSRPEVVRDFAWERFSIVCGLQEDFVLPFDTVRPDMFSAMFRAWELARSRGAQRIGAVIPSSYIARENDLLLSACAYHQRDLPQSVPPLILQPTPEGGTGHYTSRTTAWFAEHRPEMVIGKTPGAYWALGEAGWRCPQDFRFLALNLVEDRRRIAGFDWQRRRLAEAMVARMHTLVGQGLRGRREVPGTWMIECRWYDGASLP